MQKQKIRFKVVDQNRHSFLVPCTSPYCLHYKKDRVVKAKKNTIGIMVFNNIQTAKEYVRGLATKFEILEVDVHGHMKKIKTVSCGVATEDLDKFYSNRSINIMAPFPGTECYPSVKVLT